MNITELLATHLKGDLNMLKWHLDDFSEADTLVRPCEGANHANWQVGHLVASTGRLLALVDSSFPSPVSSEMGEKYTKETSKSDDPKQFATLAELRSVLTTLAETAHDWVKALEPSKLNGTSPDWAKDFAPTKDLFIAFIASHVQMHIGQIQVIRRRLGKPHLM
ncbi:MAG TPA: DinB family protein [Tepidisphaeraceae bacterium]|nr:DinB family protein [Tepidisphaeraceae bacterium]